MLYLAFIWHMHQPYYKDLLTQEVYLPWVRLHGIKDYLDMLKILEEFPKIHQTFNLVPCLIEQIQDYVNGGSDYFLNLSYKEATNLTKEEKEFILSHFFMADTQRILSIHPRYYELYLKRQSQQKINDHDILDLQTWFNLGWFDPYFRKNIPELNNLVHKGRFFTEEEKRIVLDKQKEILKEILPAYKKMRESGQIEISISPYYHPILPLLYNTKIGKEANPKIHLPKTVFSHPEDAAWHIREAVNAYKNNFGSNPKGMWPSEEAVSEHIIPLLIESGINWVITDESILFKSLKKKRKAELLYQPYCLEREGGKLNILFRDTNLSDLIGFVYHRQKAADAVSDFMKHLENIAKLFKGKDCLVTIALDGENPWEYYPNDGWDFLRLLYQKISESNFIKTVTVSEYLETNPPQDNIKKLSAGSWIYGNLNKWIGSPQKNLAWEYLTKARAELENSEQRTENRELAWKQIYICEGSDWFWWYDENNPQFDFLFRRHLSNFYTLIGKEVPDYLKKPL